MKIGRFVVDSHIHATTRYEFETEPKEEEPAIKILWGPYKPYDNSDIIVYDMDAYGIDMGIILPSFPNTSNELAAAIVDKYPKRFRACCSDQKLRAKCARGETEWNIEDALAEIEDALKWGKGKFVGIGEFAPGGMGVKRNRLTFRQRLDEFRAIAELAAKHDNLVIYFHEYDIVTSNWEGASVYEGLNILVNVASEYPKVPFLIAHGGGQYPEDIRQTCSAVGMLDNVYLETGYWLAEYYEIPAKDPNIGPTRLIWSGGDTGSTLWTTFPMQPGAKYRNPTGFWLQTKWRIPQAYQPDWYGWSTHQINRLKDLNLLTQDEINLIVGGNAARIFKLPVPFDRMFACGRPDLYGIHWRKSIPFFTKEQNKDLSKDS
jgi:predicted TIM-barrel fold metal-dependent hydrolase